MSVLGNTMAVVTGQRAARPRQAYRPLETADLTDRTRDGDLVRLSLRLVRVSLRRTPAGLGWAVLHGSWRGREVRCVAFPAQWAQIEAKPSSGDGVVLRGLVSFRDGQPCIRVLHLTRLALVPTGEERTGAPAGSG